MLKGFRDFILARQRGRSCRSRSDRRRVTAIVNAMVADIINPLIAAIVHKPDFPPSWSTSMAAYQVRRLPQRLDLVFDHRRNRLLSGRRAGQHLDGQVPPQGSCGAHHQTVPECLSDIPLAAKRCSHCAQLVA